MSGEAVLVGDVGGTHARFALVDVSSNPPRVARRLTLEADYRHFEDAVRACLERIDEKPRRAAIAVAGPVANGSVTFTNRGWHASEDGLKRLGFSRAILINDFVALAYGVIDLDRGAFQVIGPELPGLADEPISIVGAGTGFGVSCLARYRGRTVPLSTEGGHVGFAPSSEREAEIFRTLARRFGRVSIERILSGPGLENLYSALAELDGRTIGAPEAAEIQLRADAGDASALEAVILFCGILGTVAGDVALMHGARAGVFLAGGVLQKLAHHLAAGAFRARFEAKGRLSGYVKQIPTCLILSEDVAFLGAARASLELQEP